MIPEFYSRSLQFFASIIFATVFVACIGAHNVEISKQDLNQIKSISIDPYVIVPDLPFVQGQNVHKYGWLGGVGATAGTVKDSELFLQYLKTHNIEMSAIIFNSFKDAIERKELFQVSDDRMVQPQLQLRVGRYGFGVAEIFDKENVKPLIYVHAFLVTEGTKIIWRKSEYISRSSKTAKYPLEQLLKEPEIVERSLDEISDLIADIILSDLEGS